MEIDDKYCTKTIARFESLDGSYRADLYRRLEFYTLDGFNVAYVGSPTIGLYSSRLATAQHYFYASHLVVRMTEDPEIFRIEKTVNLEFRGMLGKIVEVNE